jgi:serine/threonine protein kinase
LDQLVRQNLLTSSFADRFLADTDIPLSSFKSAEALGSALVDSGGLTTYQMDRIMTGSTHGLVLGQYRVLDRLGAGGMGVVFLGEHMMMQRRVAIKVMPVEDDCAPTLIQRFYNEMRVLAQLHHPNIVMAYDSGRVKPPPGFPLLLYLVMELVDGCDLEQYVMLQGPVAIPHACRWISQAARGLQEAHHRGLVHRDVKPSNLLLTREEQVKIVDFGLVRQFSCRMTDPKSTLGTLDYMPPEQASDPSTVGTHADIYALGATLFWLLTGSAPYPRAGSVAAALRQLQNAPPQRLRALRPDAPVELEAILVRMLDRDPMRRPPMALGVAKFLEPFTQFA